MTDTNLAAGAIGFATAGVNMMLAEAPVDALGQVPWDKIGSGVSFVLALILALKYTTKQSEKAQEEMKQQFLARIGGLEKDKALLIDANEKYRESLLDLCRSTKT